jgi:drug/metabolite transporter (DMT)-like permease
MWSAFLAWNWPFFPIQKQCTLVLMNKQTLFPGALYSSLATIAVGSSVAVSSLLVSYPPLASQSIRYALGAGALALIIRLRKEPMPRPRWRDLWLLLALALSGLVGFNLCLLAAMRYSDPAAVGAFLGCVPIALALLAPLLQRKAPRPVLILSAVVVSVGAVIAQGASAATPLGILLASCTLVGEAAFTLLAVPLLPRLGALVLSMYVCIIASIVFALLAVVIDGLHALPPPTLPQVLAILYLAFIVTSAAFLAWYAGLAQLGAEKAGLFAGIIPVSSLLFGALIGANTLTPLRFLGAGLIGLGVSIGLYLSSRVKTHAQATSSAVDQLSASP